MPSMIRWMLFVGATLILSACSAEPVEPEGQTAGVPSDAGSLVIYSGRSESLVDPIIQQFSETTGIDVQVRYGSTSEIAATILEEGSNSPADIFFAQDPGGLGVIADAGLFAPLPEELLSRVDPRFAASNGLWVGISGRARVVVYNTSAVDPADLPTSMEGFTDPVWKGRIGLPPTNSSFQTMVTGMRNVWGDQATRAWLEGILANEPVFYDKNTPTVAAVAAGEVDIGFVNHYYLYRFLAEEGETFPARNYFMPDGGPGSLVMVSGAGRLASGKHEANAIQFIEFMLSTTAQQYFASSTYEYPLIDGVILQPGLTPLEDLNAIAVPLGDLADLRGTVALLQELGYLP